MNNNQRIILSVLLFFFLSNCKKTMVKNGESFNSISVDSQRNEIKREKVYEEFERTECIKRIKHKINNGEPLIIHLSVPLCDNENQGIVPVNEKLGDGSNLATNLYWGAKYGVKNYFENMTKWKLIESRKNITNEILERLIFYREYPNSAKSYLVADAYRGDKMKECLLGFFNSISGKSKKQITITGQKIGINSNADLILFNGHNGLMDHHIGYIENEDNKIRDVAVIGCISHNYFKEHLKRSRGYPLLMTTNLMAPEAYVMDAVINSWIGLKAENEIIKETGKAYNKYQNCGIRGATKLFRSGW